MKLIKSFFLLLSFFSILNASDSIKIVYNSETPPLKFTNKNHEASGLLIDIWKLWAKKTNLKIEFIKADWKNSLEMIEDGRADIHVGLYYTKEREKFLDYSSQVLYNNKKYFFYKSFLKNIKEIDDFKPYVISVDNGYPNIFMKNEYPDFSVKAFPSANKANRAFFSNETNVVLSSFSTFFYYLKSENLNEDDYKYMENTFAYGKEYLAAVKEGNKKLLKQINEGFEKFTPDDFYFIELKWTKDLDLYSLDAQDNYSLFSKNEISYLKKKKIIKMCVDPDWLPFERIHNEKHEGMIADIISLFEKTLSYPIKLVPTKTWTETLIKIKDKECDILSAAVLTSKRKKYLKFSKAYLKFPQVLVTREKEPFIDDFDKVINKKIAVVKDSGIANLLKEKYSHINLFNVKNVSEGLYKVSSGEVFGFVNTSATTTYEMAKNGLSDLKIATKVGIDYHLRIAIRDDEPELLSIINRVISKSNKEEIKKIKDNWLSVKVDSVVDYSLIYKVLAFFIFIILFILYWNRKLQIQINEKEIAQNKLNKFLQVIEQSQVSIMITNTKGQIEYVNPFCIRKTGFTSKDFIGSLPSILKSGVQDNKFYKDLWKTIQNGRTWNGEFSNKKKNGVVFWESAVIAPIYDEKNKIKYFVSIKEDITEKVKIKKELELSKEEALSANQAKSEFLAKMSHEIRTPMNGVLGMLYLLEKTNLDPIQKSYVKKVNTSANSLLGVINDILDFSKIEAHKLEIKNEEFNIQSLLNDIMSVMSLKAEDNNLELLSHYEKEFPLEIYSDKLRVSQILNNLLSNAIKFTKNGEILISAKTISRKNNEMTLMFSVKDTGIGISKENQKKLFQEFSQVDDSITRSFQGTGLGLAISKRLCHLLGGDIWIDESEEGIGTTISFTIKVKSVKSFLSNDFIFPKKISNLCVLIVDDNHLAGSILKEMLESFKYKVDLVYSGKDAIKQVLKTNYDLVFLDYKMPELNGIETYIKYKEILQENVPKTILITAYSQELFKNDIQECGIKSYITKPIFPSILYDTIMETLNDENSTSLKYKNEDNFSKLLENKKVLLVEDNILNQEFAMTILKSFGLDVYVAGDGLEAISEIKTKKYALILMDIQMPKLDGLEVTSRVRKFKDKYFKELPIIALSANALQGDREKSLFAGMNEHITKPIDPQKLFEVLKEFIKEKENRYLKNINKRVLDTKEAIRRVSNNEKAYIKILEQFYNNYKSISSDIEYLILHNDIKSLEKKIHELKGICGNIAAKKLFSTLSDMNTVLDNNKTPPLNMFHEFKNNLNEVLNEISKIQNNKKIKSKSFDKQKVEKLLNIIEENLNMDILKCELANEELKAYLEHRYKNFSQDLTNSLNEFDSDKSNKLIKSFLKDIKDE